MAEPTAHTEQPAGKTAFPPFQAEHFPSQLVWLTISFVLLYVLMSKIALPRIGAIMAERSRLIGDDLAAAERLKEQSNAAHAAYEKSLADARGRAQSIASSTREKQAAEAEAAQKRSRQSCTSGLPRPNSRSRRRAPPPWAMCGASRPTPPPRSSSA